MAVSPNQLDPRQIKAAELRVWQGTIWKDIAKEIDTPLRALHYWKSNSKPFKKYLRELYAEQRAEITAAIDNDAEANLKFLLNARDGKVPELDGHRVRIALALLDRTSPAVRKSESLISDNTTPVALKIEGLESETDTQVASQFLEDEE